MSGFFITHHQKNKKTPQRALLASLTPFKAPCPSRDLWIIKLLIKVCTNRLCHRLKSFGM